MSENGKKLNVDVHNNSADGVDYLQVTGPDVLEFVVHWNNSIQQAVTQERDAIIALLEAGATIDDIRLRGEESSNDGAYDV